MTIITEVHVGAAQFMLAKEELNNAKQYRETQSAIAEHTKSLWLTNSTTDLTLAREKVNHILAEVRLDGAQASIESAYATLRAAIGEEAVPMAIEGQAIDGLAEAVRRLWEPSRASVATSVMKEEPHASMVAR